MCKAGHEVKLCNDRYTPYYSPHSMVHPSKHIRMLFLPMSPPFLGDSTIVSTLFMECQKGKQQLAADRYRNDFVFNVKPTG